MNDDRLSPTRRQIMATAGAGVALAALSRGQANADPLRATALAELTPRLKEIRDRYFQIVRQWVDRKQLTRSDGYAYTVDIAELLICFAQAGDAEGYAILQQHAKKHLIFNDPSQPYIKGFVPWRWKAGEKPDASGTTEALRLARGLWLGAKAFNRPADRELALLALDGYARHATTERGIWIVRNYFNFQTGGFASNSFLVDYDPDFVREVAVEAKNADLSALADRCYAVVESAVAPSGLLYDLIQPELATLYPELNLAVFSPNDVIQLSNCCATATAVAGGLPGIARRVLAFGLNRVADLRTYYQGRTGEPYNEKAATVSDFNVLTRLAVQLGEGAYAATLADRTLNDWRWCVDRADQLGLYMACEILLTMQALLGLKP